MLCFRQHQGGIIVHDCAGFFQDRRKYTGWMCKSIEFVDLFKNISRKKIWWTFYRIYQPYLQDLNLFSIVCGRNYRKPAPFLTPVLAECNPAKEADNGNPPELNYSDKQRHQRVESCT